MIIVSKLSLVWGKLTHYGHITRLVSIKLQSEIESGIEFLIYATTVYMTQVKVCKPSAGCI